jgi:hypothetical protein
MGVRNMDPGLSLKIPNHRQDVCLRKAARRHSMCLAERVSKEAGRQPNVSSSGVRPPNENNVKDLNMSWPCCPSANIQPPWVWRALEAQS